MSQLTITLSDKADALIAQLQKEIFNRRRKKVSAAGVVETLVESGAKSQSDKRFATSWTNLIADIEKAAKVVDAYGSKPADLSDAEWALVLSHRTRAASSPKPAARPRAKGTLKSAAATVSPKAARPATSKAAPQSAAKAPAGATARRARATAAPAAKAASTTAKAAAAGRKTAAAKPAASRTPRASAGPAKGGSAARRMAKAAGRLGVAAGSAPAAAAPSSNGAGDPAGLG